MYEKTHRYKTLNYLCSKIKIYFHFGHLSWKEHCVITLIDASYTATFIVNM
jgi:hypothetical protein